MISRDQREFHCKHCSGKIMIPVDLPPTTAPCPHCGNVITSPELEIPVVSVPAYQPPPVPILERTPPLPPPPEIPPTPVSEKPEKPPAEDDSPELAPLTKISELKANNPKHSRLIPAVLTLLALLLLVLGGFYFVFYVMNQNAASPATQAASDDPKTHGLNSNKIVWQKDAYQLLQDFMAATRDKDKAAFILNGDKLTTQLEAFYGSGVIDDSDTPADAFAIYNLSEKDRERGLFMMIFDQAPQLNKKKILPPPASIEARNTHSKADFAHANDNFASESRRIYAFFKRTPNGLKLDWEIFAQTKYRTLQNFLALRKVGESKVFRVFIVEDTPEKSPTAASTLTYRLADPANTSDTTRVSVKEDSEMARTLSRINWRGTTENLPITHTATLELKWSGEITAPKLEISRFICWEFLGLGGNQTSAPASQK